MSNSYKKTKIEHLGDLEADIMSIVWEKGWTTVQDVKDALEPRRALAYTTVMTVMTRLADKGMLARQKKGRAYTYAPAIRSKKSQDRCFSPWCAGYMTAPPARLIAHLLENDDALEDTELERLEELIRAKRSGKHSSK